MTPCPCSQTEPFIRVKMRAEMITEKKRRGKNCQHGNMCQWSVHVVPPAFVNIDSKPSKIVLSLLMTKKTRIWHFRCCRNEVENQCVAPTQSRRIMLRVRLGAWASTRDIYLKELEGMVALSMWESMLILYKTNHDIRTSFFMFLRPL